MGRRYPYLLRQKPYIQTEEGHHPGCIWGLRKFLNYHGHWKFVKKIIPHKTKKKRSNYNKDAGNQKACHGPKIAANDEPTHVHNTGSVSKRSFKTRIKELMAKEERSVASPKDSKPLDLEDVDILELFRVNKQVFLKMLREHQLHSKGRFTKSGSFPSVSSATMADWGPRKLEDKQREIWVPNTKSEGIQVTVASKGKHRSMRRANSLTESVDRYSQLFGSDKDIKRSLTSRSLKVLFNDNDEPNPKLKRRLSLPECDYDEAFLHKLELSKDSAETCEGVVSQEMNDEISHTGETDDIELSIIDCDAQETQGLVPLSQGLEMEIPETGKTDQILSVKKLEDEDSNRELCYVKLVLEQSGFTAKEGAWVWYTIEQPLNPSVFYDIEKHYCRLEHLERSTKMEESKWSRKLIFNLINEALVEIDERSCLYYPRALSFSCRVHLIPKGEQLLGEVWSFVGRWLGWRPELDPASDLAVAQDLNGRNGWMNLQIESECVALEVEDMILDELLDDILHSCS